MARTDGDTWDLASSVGATATMVAAQRALGHREKLIDDPFAEPLVRAVGVDFFTRMLDDEVSFTDIDPAFTVRRAAEGMAVRTRFFDQMFLDAAAAGTRQAVILAAGLDARGYRLPWPDGTTVYEVDQPEVIEFKTRTLAAIGAEPTATHRLRRDRPSRRTRPGVDRQRFRPHPADVVERRGAADLPSPASPGCAVRHHHRPVGSGEPSRHGACSRPDGVHRRALRAAQGSSETAGFRHRDGRPRLSGQAEQPRRLPPPPRRGGVTALPNRAAYAANGFEFPDDEMSKIMGDLSYVRAEFTG